MLVFAGLTAGKAVLNSLFDDFKGMGENASRSADEARRRGILVADLVVEPAEFEVPGGRIRFGPAWVEERSLSGHVLVWFPTEVRRGGYRVHFTAEVPAAGRDDQHPVGYFFVVGDEGNGAVESRSRGQCVYGIETEARETTALRLSAVRSGKEPRAKNIRFVPKR